MASIQTDEDFDEPFMEDRADRWSKNSTGVKEGEFLGPRLISHDHSVQHGGHRALSTNAHTGPKEKDGKMLAIVFVMMVFIGLGNKVFNKLQTIPMYNYPNFLNLLTTFVYIPVCFAYIIPMARRGWIPKEQLDMPKRPFAIMGGLDAMAGIMQIFSSTYLPGPLLILLSQAAIPVSMLISKYLLKAEYKRTQYLGALIVAGGIMIVLAPTISGSGSVVWAIVMILSTVPMALSSVYKEIALGETELDPIYLNGWIAVFQLLFSLILCVPSSLASDPPVPIPELPQNLWNGLLCYLGHSTITCSADDVNCTPDQCFPDAPMFVTIYLFFNQLYNLLIILILKYGSSNLLYLALTLMVPLGNAAFTLPFVPGHKPLQSTDIIGLVVICFGLGCYRFLSDVLDKYWPQQRQKSKSFTSDEKTINFYDAEPLLTNTSTGPGSGDAKL